MKYFSVATVYWFRQSKVSRASVKSRVSNRWYSFCCVTDISTGQTHLTAYRQQSAYLTPLREVCLTDADANACLAIALYLTNTKYWAAANIVLGPTTPTNNPS